MFAVDHVVKIASRLVPEPLVERASCRLRGAGVAVGVGVILTATSRSQPSSSRKALYQRALISTALPRRGVTTQSPTLASIQVSWYPCGPLAQQSVAGIDADAEPRTREMMLGDVEQPRQEGQQALAVAGPLQVAIDRVEEPERGVGGMVQAVASRLPETCWE